MDSISIIFLVSVNSRNSIGKENTLLIVPDAEPLALVIVMPAPFFSRLLTIVLPTATSVSAG